MNIRAWCSACKYKGDCQHDGTHAHCPRCGAAWRHYLPDNYEPPPKEQTPKHSLGPGTALKDSLARFGFKETEGCGCGAHAATMDKRGPDWCEENIETIVGWLRESAEKQRLPFSAWLAKLFVKRAIRKSRASPLV
jgi:hypothetical protein